MSLYTRSDRSSNVSASRPVCTCMAAHDALLMARTSSVSVRGAPSTRNAAAAAVIPSAYRDVRSTASLGERADSLTNTPPAPCRITAVFTAASSLASASSQGPRVALAGHSFRILSSCPSQNAASSSTSSTRTLRFSASRFAYILTSSTYRSTAEPSSWRNGTMDGSAAPGSTKGRRGGAQNSPRSMLVGAWNSADQYGCPASGAAPLAAAREPAPSRPERPKIAASMLTVAITKTFTDVAVDRVADQCMNLVSGSKGCLCTYGCHAPSQCKLGCRYSPRPPPCLLRSSNEF
mmetsp:Transcript_1090/g.3128  ORF Transcript_1090/g.3128 Transcript_1090/m.3128 type:complete len:292 (-) Transcript_1090:9-884(-)